MIASDRSSHDADESSDKGDGVEERIRAAEPALQNDRRQRIVQYLADNSGETALSSIALSLAAESEKTLSAIIEELHGCHIPRLVAHELVEQENGVLRLLIEPNRAAALVSRANDKTD
jgi:hypothetical protein